MDLDAGGLVRRSLGALRRGLLGRPTRQSHTGVAQAAPTDTLILFYNTMWDQPLGDERVPLPAGCQVTTDRGRLPEAAAVVFHIPSLTDLPTVKMAGQLWVAWSLECMEYYPQFRAPAFTELFDLTMTYRLDADVVASYTGYYGSGDSVVRALRTPPRPKRADHLASLFISSRFNQSGRMEYASELLRHLDVHSYGMALRNREIPDDQGRSSKLSIIADHAFEFAFENAIAEDYVTEKFFDPLVCGTVPVYRGAPNIEMFAPGDHCFINVADFSGPQALAEYLCYLQDHDAEYAAYLTWKERPFRPEFLSLLARQEGHPFTRLCRAVQARRSLLP